MLLEGTRIYFFLIFLIFLAVYITVRICLGSLFKRAKEKAWRGYVPIYSGYVLVNLLELPKSIFYRTLIPIVNLYYYNIIIKKLLESFALDPKDSIWYIVIPMYKFPELVFKKPRFILNEYELTNEFVETENVLFKSESNEPVTEPVMAPTTENFNQNVMDAAFNENKEVKSTDPNNITSYINDSVYGNTTTEEQQKKVTYVEAKPEEKKEVKPIITPLGDGKQKLCPQCGATLNADMPTCFMCGYRFD